MKKPIGNKYRITGYLEKPLYEKFVEYQDRIGLSESAVLSLILQHFFSKKTIPIQIEALREEIETQKEEDTKDKEKAQEGFKKEGIKETEVKKEDVKEIETEKNEKERKKFKFYFDF